MTGIASAPAPKGIRTKRGGLYVTDAEIVERLNVPENIAYAAIHSLDANKVSGFPQKQALFGNRRYWPAVQRWFDKFNGLIEQPKPEIVRPAYPQERRRA